MAMPAASQIPLLECHFECADCGSEEVERATWLNPNTGDVAEPLKLDGELVTRCLNCGSIEALVHVVEEETDETQVVEMELDPEEA